MSGLAAATCTAVLSFVVSMGTLVGVNESKQSTKAIIESQKQVQNEQPQQIVNNYVDNSITNIDNSTTIIDNSVTEEDEVVESEPITDEEIVVEESVNDAPFTLPLGDENNDLNSDPNVVLIKGIKCPICGEHSYTEMYNKKDSNFVHYIGRCTSCNYEY